VLRPQRLRGDEPRSDARTEGARSIRRAIHVLRLLAAGQERGVRLIDLVGASALPRPTVHRILRVLLEEGAVEQDRASRRYMIGPEASLLGLARKAIFPIRALADPSLEHLCRQVGDTVFLTIRSGLDSVCVDRRVGSYPLQVLALEIGARRPRALAVAIVDAAPLPVAAVSIAAVADRLSPARMPLMLALLREQAESISRRLIERSRRTA
jgi:DNA-binding IclR family transcriptional regulator